MPEGLKVAIIGAGYWGPNLVRNFVKSEACDVLMVADHKPEKLANIKKTYPHIEVTESADQVFSNNHIDAVAIATPVSTHFDLVRAALQANKHVLVEKSFTSNAVEAGQLVKLAEERQRVLMVDHTYLYTGAVQHIKKLIENNELGTPQYFDSIRINLGLFQDDINVISDLATHDIAILNYLVNFKPIAISANGISHSQNAIENIAYLTLRYENDFIAHINCSWSSPVKIRRILIGGTKKMVLYDDVEPTEKIKLYSIDQQSSAEKDKVIIDYRRGDIFVPHIAPKEPLENVVEDFLTAINKNKQPLSDMHAGLRVMQIIEAANKSIKNSGLEVPL